MHDTDLTPDAYFSIDIAKVEDQPDGTVMVYGCPANPETLDNDDQIADEDWLKQALPDWFHSYGNIREMHQSIAAGSATKLDWKGAKPQIAAKVVDPGSVLKVKHKVLKAFSIGVKKPETRHDMKAKGGRIVGGKIVEVSLVDRPSIPGSDIESFKAAVASGELLLKAVGANEWLDVQTGAIVEDTVAKAIDAESFDKETTGSRADIHPDRAPLGAKTDAHPAGTATRVLDLADECVYLAVDGTRLRVPYEVNDAGEISFGDPVLLGPVAQTDLLGNHLQGDEDMAVEKTADAEKREFDPDVGGGVDRDEIPAEDFAGKNRSYPIVKPGDVSDAAQSIGRAGDDNYPADTLKENIIRIAKRKGAAFVAELPEAWKDESGKAAASADDEKTVEAPIEKEAVVEDHEKAAGAAVDGDGEVADAVDGDGADKGADVEAGSALKLLKQALADKAWCAQCGQMQKVEDGVEKTVGMQRMLVGKDAAGHELHKYVGPVEKEADGDEKTVDADDGKDADGDKDDTVVADADGDGDAEKKKPFPGAAEPFKDDDGKAVDAQVEKAEETVAKLAGVEGGDRIFKTLIGEVLADALGIDLGKVGRKMASKRLERLSKAIDDLKAIAAELTEAPMADEEKAASVGGPTQTDGKSQLGVTRLLDAVKVVNQLCREIKAAADDQFAGDGHDGPDADMGEADQIRVKDRIDTNNGKASTADLTKAVTEEITKVVGPELAKSVAAHVEQAFAPLVQRLEKVEHTATPARQPILVEADRRHALDGDLQKAAHEEVLRADLEKSLAGLSDKEREENLASVVASTRGWR